MIDALPSNGVGVMELGFAGLKFLQEMSASSKSFVLRIGNNYKLEFEQETELTWLGTGK